MAIVTSTIDSPVGSLLLSASDGRLTQLSFRSSSIASPAAHDPRESEVLEATKRQLDEYFARRRSRFQIPIDLHGSDFHRRVWQLLLEIPYGETISYGKLAEMVGVAGEARAVGAANGANPIAIIVPCHRVIGADGSLVGYGGGLWRKQMLLDLEGKSLSLAF
jgi:methylated-DNA-[protein]-cysteine S-methyltransferase